VLVLDEPTNDLDLVTLNVLERLLVEFGGAVLLVTHDRYFLDKVATRILAVEGDGRVVAWPGNFTTYRTLKAQAEAARPAAPTMEARKPIERAPAPRSPVRLGYLEQRELEGMEAAIESAEARRARAEASLVDPEVYVDAARSREAQSALERATAEVERLYARWQELTERSGRS
jgi:ATP-binding cassette subfamily F protein uup